MCLSRVAKIRLRSVSERSNYFPRARLYFDRKARVFKIIQERALLSRVKIGRIRKLGSLGVESELSRSEIQRTLYTPKEDRDRCVIFASARVGEALKHSDILEA